MKKIIAAVLAAATFASTLSFAVSAATPIVIDSAKLRGSNLDISSKDPSNILVKKGEAHGDVVYPGKSLYVILPTWYPIDPDIAQEDFANKDYFSYKMRAVEGAKHVAGVEYFVGKSDMVFNGLNASGRYTYIKVNLKDNFTADENKIRLELTIKGKNKYTGSVTFTSPYIYVGNEEILGTDQDLPAGQAGRMFKPVKNEDNEIVWNDELRDIARLSFFADSDVAKTYPKLNTKWTESDYADYFANQDAFLFEFVSNPYVSSTSRATLEIYNPYYDEDTDTVTVDPADVIIYQVTEDSLVDVTELFKHGENEDGDLVFSIKTRQLGTYIFAEAEATVDEIADDDVVDMPATEIKTPVDTGR